MSCPSSPRHQAKLFSWHRRWQVYGWLAVWLCALVWAQGASYPKIEASFSITNLATDPFDFLITDVRVQLATPDAGTLNLPAFYDGGTTWRVRHTPLSPGLYQITGFTLNGGSLSVSGLQPSGGSWTVGGRPAGAGYIRVDAGNSNRFVTGDGRRFLPLGHNVAWWTNNANLPVAFHKMGAAHENWSRVWMMQFYDSLNLEWPKVGNFGVYSLPVAQKWDAIVAAAEQSGIHFQMTLQHHGQYSTQVDPNWIDNPYNTANGGFLSVPEQFFTNATAKALTKRKYRYIIARWGYSPAVMAWELFNEVQFTDAARNGQWAQVAAWHNEMAQFLRAQDPYQHLITTSSELSQPIWSECDYYQNHVYPTDLITALRDPLGVPAGQPVKPIFQGECGLDNTVQYGVNAPMWAGLMAGQSGTAQPWWWDRIEANGEYPHFRAVSDFARLAGMAEQNSLIKTSPRVTCPQVTSLVFAPGGGWGTATQHTFTLGDVAPAGVGTLPSYLQGNFHRNMTPNGYTFLVNYPAGGGTFSVQILTIAASGAGLQLILDNTTTNAINFPATGVDQNTNYTLSINVPGGAHTVRLWNPGQDWVNLGNIILNPYASMLAAYQVGNSNFAALWIWHRTNVYRLAASASVGGTVPLSGLQPGPYAACWWDTFAGVAISNFNFTVADTNPVVLTVPSVLRSIAFYAGPPAQAILALPTLSHTLGTNSPPLRLPLAITNSGGLPLSWSLSVTGYNQLAYTAIPSSQPGGPVFAWKDISSIGRDLRTNFSALTAKTARDEGIAGPIDIGFKFPFFSGSQAPDVFTQLFVSPNGFVSFAPFAGDTSTNKPLPQAQSPTNLIACFWDDLDLATAGHVYVAQDSIEGTFTVQYQNVNFKGSAATVSCQVILKSTGEIITQYKTIGISNACTVGIQNAAGNAGLQLAYDQPYLQSNMAILWRPAGWLDVHPAAGLTPRNSRDLAEISLNPAGLAYGHYQATLTVQTADPNQALVTVPIDLEISPIATWRQTWFGTAANAGSAADTADPDSDGWANIFEYAFHTSPVAANGSPLAVALNGQHLTITFSRPRPAPADINYLFEVSNNLSGGPWQSGPAFTSQSVVDNGDGTETVMVTDLAEVGSTAAHFVRVRIVRF